MYFPGHSMSSKQFNIAHTQPPPHPNWPPPEKKARGNSAAGSLSLT